MSVERDVTRTSEITFNGVRTVVRESGPVAQPEAVVFLHGHPGSSEDWLDLLPVAGQHARAVAIDLPGYGLADKPENFDYTVPGLMAYLEGALEILGIRHVHLVVHDLGCFVGIAWAAKYRARVGSITFFNAGLMPGYRWHFAARIWRVPLLGELAMASLTRPAFRIGMRLINPRPLPKAFVQRMYNEYGQRSRQAALCFYRSIDDPGVASQQVGSLLKGSSWPVLVIWGDKDLFLPYVFAHRQRQFFPNAEITILRGCGHWPFVDETEQVIGLMDDFLRRQFAA